MARFLIKTYQYQTFFEKSLQNIWWLAKNSLPLHPQIRNRPLRLAQVGIEEEPIEHLTTDQKVVGLNPAGITKKENDHRKVVIFHSAIKVYYTDFQYVCLT